MKRFYLFFMLLLLMLLNVMAALPAYAQQKPRLRAFWAYTGGATGALDRYRSDGVGMPQGRPLITGDMALVLNESESGLLVYDSTSTQDHDPPRVVMPVDAPAVGRWLLTPLLAPALKGVPVENPFYRLYSSGGTDWWWGANDADGTMEFRNAYGVGRQVRMKILDALAMTTNEATAMYLVTRDSSGNISLNHVTLGATDSGGTGYRCLRVPNINN